MPHQNRQAVSFAKMSSYAHHGATQQISGRSFLTRRTTTRLSSAPSFFSSAWMGALSGMVGITAVYPIDVVKTRLQSGLSSGALQMMQKIIHQEGPLALYKGLLPQLCGTGPDKAVSLATRNYLRQLQQDPTSVASLMTSAAGAGAMQSTIMSPVEIVKVRMQLDSTLRMSSVITSLGTSGLYRGFSACLARDVAFSTAYFTLYELTKEHLAGTTANPSIATCLAAGVAAGIPSAFITTPLDVLKTKMQSQAGNTTLISLFQQTLQQEGIAGLFRGWGPRVTRIAPQFGIVLVTYDYLTCNFS